MPCPRVRGLAAPGFRRAEVWRLIATGNPETVATDEARLGCDRPSIGRCRTQGQRQWVIKSLAGGLWERKVRLNFLSSRVLCTRCFQTRTGSRRGSRGLDAAVASVVIIVLKIFLARYEPPITPRLTMRNEVGLSLSAPDQNSARRRSR